MASVAIVAAIKIAKAGYDFSVAAKANVKTAQAMGQRLQLIAELVEAIGERFGNNIPQQLQDDLHDLELIMNECNEFIKACASENSATAYFKSKGHEREYYRLDKELTNIIGDLSHHALGIATTFGGNETFEDAATPAVNGKPVTDAKPLPFRRIRNLGNKITEKF
eukprot:Opistho-1_new@83676